MTSTPVSLNDSSLNGSWIDINSASQIPSPLDNETPEFLAPPYSPNQPESIQNLGLISFQVERFLREAASHQNNNNQQQQSSGNHPPDNYCNLNSNTSNQHNQPFRKFINPNDSQAAGGDDNNSGIYVSDSETSLDALDSKALMMSLKWIQQQEQFVEANTNTSDPHKKHQYLTDQLSDSLSLLSRASPINEPPFEQTNLEDFDWLWDWTAQPEYFTGQEWKVYAPKQEYLMRQRQMYQSHGNNPFSGDVVSLLFLTNFLSIIIGAGLTYSIMMRRSSV